ncbi:MAG: DUF4836 family protein [Taibaiella sp.]|nr:DUF4836 family protein [Taibaiella sp.]
MLRHLRAATVICVSVIFLSACNNVPDHRKYIPKDASLVAGINLKSLGKTIAWNMVTGSKLFKEMQKKVPENNGSNLMSGIDKAGIDALNTFYVYLKSDNRFNNGIKVTGLVPLNDAGQWETYVKNNFPKAAITDHKGIKSAALGTDMYVGWNKNLLIIINVIENKPQEPLIDPADENYPPQENPTPAPPVAAAPIDMAAEMDIAFHVADDNTINNNKNFTKLENSGHDITLWINYEQIMSQYMSDPATAAMGGVSLSPAFWKETAFACGFDFKKGKITGDMTYYSSDEMAGIYKEFGANNADKDMIARMPSQNLDMMLAMHLSTKGIKAMMDKTGLLGLANSGLSTQGTDVDNILDAFTGDMAFTMNDLIVKNATGGNQPARDGSRNTDGSISYVIKINNKAKFSRLMDIAKASGMMMPVNQGYAVPVSEHDSFFIAMNDNYLAVSNRYATAGGILAGEYKAAKLPAEAAKQLEGHPFALYFDIQRVLQNINPGSYIPREDSVIYSESKKLLTDFSINGGNFKDNAMQSHLELNFSNKEESSIITLLDFGMKINDAIEKNNSSRQGY